VLNLPGNGTLQYDAVCQHCSPLEWWLTLSSVTWYQESSSFPFFFIFTCSSHTRLDCKTFSLQEAKRHLSKIHFSLHINFLGSTVSVSMSQLAENPEVDPPFQDAQELVSDDEDYYYGNEYDDDDDDFLEDVLNDADVWDEATGGICVLDNES
jgi:hypothetical protein